MNDVGDPLTGWRAPDEELIRAVLARIGDRQHRRVFFERLENPRWVDALDAKQVFDSPPETMIDGAGRELWTPWPEGDFLVRMAALTPASVSRILLRASTSANPYVHDIVLQAALRLPVSEAEVLVAPIQGYVTGGSLRDGEQVVAAIERFASQGARSAALALAEAAFRPRPGEDSAGDRSRRRDVAVGLDRYWYDELLPRALVALDTVLGDDVLSTVARWLELFQETSGDYSPESGSDLSYIWRPAIANHSQNSRYHELGDSLVEAVRDRALSDVRAGRPLESVLRILERSGQPLLARIALHTVATTASASDDSRSRGYAMLTDTRYLDAGGFRHEYAELGQAIIPLLTPEESQSWEALILNGPPLAREELIRRASFRLDPEEPQDEAVRHYEEVWQLNILGAIGAERLPEASRARLASLVATYGEPEHPEFPSYSSSWSGPNSPVDAEELAGLPVAEVRTFLATWQPEGSEPWGASKEGLARIFQTVVAGRSYEFSEASEQFADLDPTYARSLFAGFTDAVNHGASVDWNRALAAARVVMERPDDGADFEGGMDEDVVWRFAQRAVASFVEQGATSEGESGIPPELLAKSVQVLAPVMDHPDPTPDHEERYGGSNMDPLTLSLNTTRPSVIRAVARVAAHARTLRDEGVASEVVQETIDSALRLLDTRLRPSRDPSLASAAAFGEALGRLIWIDRDWTVRHSDELMSADAFGDVVLSTALATYRAHRTLIEVVGPAARNLIDRAAAGAAPIPGWRTDRTPVELIGDHLVLLRVQDAIPVDDPLLLHFFDVAPIGARSRVLGHLGWLLLQWEEVPAEPLERAASLWDSRAAAVAQGASSAEELSGFYWWVRARKFEDAWWLPRLAAAARSRDFDPKGMLGEVLEETAAHAPNEVASILELLLSTRDDPFGRYDLVRHAPGILAAAFNSGDPATVETAERIMDKLGRTGHLQIAELVQARRNRRQGL